MRNIITLRSFIPTTAPPDLGNGPLNTEAKAF